jgi:hypothetical protein
MQTKGKKGSFNKEKSREPGKPFWKSRKPKRAASFKSKKAA